MTYAISIVKGFFGFFVSENIFHFSLLDLIIDISQQHCENFRNNEQAELVENLPPSLPTDFCMICIHFYYGKK